jgi:hypothetical protein
MAGSVNLYDNVYADFGSELQRFLGCVETLSVERRLSRFAYLADKPSRGG